MSNTESSSHCDHIHGTINGNGLGIAALSEQGVERIAILQRCNLHHTRRA